jgi:hypothetical protein
MQGPDGAAAEGRMAAVAMVDIVSPVQNFLQLPTETGGWDTLVS